MKNVFDLLRVHQWIKNAFILSPLFFSGNLNQSSKLIAALITTASFCAVVSSVYIFNDFLDHPTDLLHPFKKKRPLSARSVSLDFALKLAALLLGFGIVLSLLVNKNVFAIILTYLIVHLIYNGWARKIMLMDILFIALGFQLRIWAGAFAVDVQPSAWLLLCALVLALFLGLIKRRCEIDVLKENAVAYRPALAGYKAFPLDVAILFFSILTIISYSLYTTSHEMVMPNGHHMMFYSSIFVIAGISRYLYLVYVKKAGDDPAEILLKDSWSVINIFLWLIYISMVLYFKI